MNQDEQNVGGVHVVIAVAASAQNAVDFYEARSPSMPTLLYAGTRQSSQAKVTRPGVHDAIIPSKNHW
jgi:hypothetical protein